MVLSMQCFKSELLFLIYLFVFFLDFCNLLFYILGCLMLEGERSLSNYVYGQTAAEVILFSVFDVERVNGQKYTNVHLFFVGCLFLQNWPFLAIIKISLKFCLENGEWVCVPSISQVLLWLPDFPWSIQIEQNIKKWCVSSGSV